MYDQLQGHGLIDFVSFVLSCCVRVSVYYPMTTSVKNVPGRKVVGHALGSE